VGRMINVPKLLFALPEAGENFKCKNVGGRMIKI
jgi:hypothetical protein